MSEPSALEVLVPNALAFMARYHGATLDKNGQLYIWHPIRVAQNLRHAGFGPVYQAVGLLHDTVEDTEAALDDILELFGEQVHQGMDAMTRRGHFEPHPIAVPGKPTPEWVWDETYKEYVVRCCEDPVGRKVKRFDVYDNANPRRFCEGVPVGRYIWTLNYLDDLERGEVLSAWEAAYRSV